MISKGKKIRIHPLYRYPNNPEKNVDIEIGEDKIGKFQLCQTMDINNKGSTKTQGFLYVKIYSDLPLALDDFVTIKDVLWLQVKARLRRTEITMGITIVENAPFTVREDESGDGEYDF